MGYLDNLADPLSSTNDRLLSNVSDPNLKTALNKRLLYDKRELNAQFPNEYEYYMVALELILVKEDTELTEKYFIFPIMPSQLTEKQNFSSNIKKSIGGITVLDSPTFIPVDINLSGNFGRKLKFVAGESYEDLLGSFQTIKDTSTTTEASEINVTTKKSIYNGVLRVLNEKMKTGYGCLKILEEIIAMSKALSAEGRQYKLIFYNLALGNSYIVKPMDFSMSQSEQSNMIWNYTLQLKGIAPLNFYNQKAKTNEQLSTDDHIQKQVNNLSSRLNRVVRGVSNRVPVLR